MLKVVDKKYCKGDLVQLMPCSDSSQLIISADEIILLKMGDIVFINKYEKHPKRDLFPYSDRTTHHIGFSRNYNELFEYNKLYLNFRGSVSGFNLHKYFFFKGTNRALWLNEGLNVDERDLKSHSVELTREELKEKFDSDKYDAMYVLDKNGWILFAGNKKDGKVINKKIIPNDREIEEMDLKRRSGMHNNCCLLNRNIDTKENYERTHTKRSIREIKNLRIYGSALFGKFANLLITVEDGKFDVNWFRIDLVEQNRFKLTTSKINLAEPTVDDVIKYVDGKEIEQTPEPDEEEEYYIKDAISRIDTSNLEEIKIDPMEEKSEKRGFSLRKTLRVLGTKSNK